MNTKRNVQSAVKPIHGNEQVLNIKDFQITETEFRPDDMRAYMRYPTVLGGVLVEDIDALELLGMFYEGCDKQDSPFQGLLTEDGERGLDNYILGPQRLEAFLRWVSHMFGDEVSILQLCVYWNAYNRYEQTHILELYAKYVPAEDRHKYATWAQALEYRRKLHDYVDEKLAESRKFNE